MTKQDTGKPSVPAATFSPYLIRRHRRQLCDWVQANGIDPDHIPDHHPIRVEEGKGGPVIHYRAYILTDDGAKQLDPDRPDEALTEDRTTPCTVPPPDLSAAAQPDAEANE